MEVGFVRKENLTSHSATAHVSEPANTEGIIKEADTTKLYTMKGIVRVGEREAKVLQQKDKVKDDFFLFDVAGQINLTQWNTLILNVVDEESSEFMRF